MILDSDDSRLLDRVIYSALCDCIDAGVGAEAHLILKLDQPRVWQGWPSI